MMANKPMNNDRMRYSLLRNAIAPSAIAEDISVNFATSSGEEAPESIEMAFTRRE